MATSPSVGKERLSGMSVTMSRDMSVTMSRVNPTAATEAARAAMRAGKCFCGRLGAGMGLTPRRAISRLMSSSRPSGAFLRLSPQAVAQIAYPLFLHVCPFFRLYSFIILASKALALWSCEAEVSGLMPRQAAISLWLLFSITKRLNTVRQP